MPIDLRDIAAISGMSGLFRMLKPTRNGVIVETLTATPSRVVAQARNRISLLHEISIYTTDEETTVPLAEVFERVHEKYGKQLPFGDKPSNQEMVTFMAAIVPDYDRERVYLSDIKKLINWFGIVSQHVPFTEAPAEEEEETAKDEAGAGKDEAPKTAKIKSKKATEPAADTEKTAEEKKAKKPAAKKTAAKEEKDAAPDKEKKESKTKKSEKGTK